MAVVASAPGRVNLIGEHVDYVGGLVLPMAIDRRVRVSVAPARGDATTVRSTLTGGDVPIARVVLELLETPPLNVIVDSDLPAGAGLSSSAALAVATATAAAHITGRELEPLDHARLCREAELRATGTPCGLMDQLACVFGRAGHAMLIDCATDEVTPVAWPDPDVVVLVIDSGVRRALADGRYAAVREGIESDLASGVASPRARHVTTEIARVRAAVDALRAGDWPVLGGLLREGHASLRDDLKVTCPELDLLVDLLDRPGVFGARMTGGGFGGSVIALAERAAAETVGAEVVDAYARQSSRSAGWLTATPADGAAVCAVA